MEVKIILVEPRYDSNVGAVARVMKNFGFSDFYIVRPKCELGLEAVKYAKHAKEILEDVKKFETIEDATNGCDVIVGTSAIVRRNKDTLRSLIKLEEFESTILKSKRKKRKIAFVFGNEGTGLSAADITKCDLLIKIETSKEYPIMNLSHSAAIVLYNVAKTIQNIESETEEESNRSQREKILEYSKEITDIANVRSKKYVLLAMKRIFSKSNITKKEANFLIGFLNDLKKKLSKEL